MHGSVHAGYIEDDEYAKQGISGEEYRAALNKYDDGNGSYKQEEVYAALKSMNLTDKQREYLWAENGWKKTYREYKPSVSK